MATHRERDDALRTTMGRGRGWDKRAYAGSDVGAVIERGNQQDENSWKRKLRLKRIVEQKVAELQEMSATSLISKVQEDAQKLLEELREIYREDSFPRFPENSLWRFND